MDFKADIKENYINSISTLGLMKEIQVKSTPY